MFTVCIKWLWHNKEDIIEKECVSYEDAMLYLNKALEELKASYEPISWIRIVNNNIEDNDVICNKQLTLT